MGDQRVQKLKKMKERKNNLTLSEGQRQREQQPKNEKAEKWSPPKWIHKAKASDTSFLAPKKLKKITTDSQKERNNKYRTDRKKQIAAYREKRKKRENMQNIGKPEGERYKSPVTTNDV